LQPKLNIPITVSQKSVFSLKFKRHWRNWNICELREQSSLVSPWTWAPASGST